ncbi:Hypothetical protein, putative [Bodo saltans]|uniref:Uncharacterized protein n=1 Tax=Bodo saltans TaxID=75058 RepID=A0A0S4IPT6_BODSA|nr:Hypothetical protein, putative [Bodo saltans]|eukprot:CUF04150.1 Hypothetical protein, putative [Bodo saltans]
MDVLQCKWSRLISSQPSVRIPAPDAGGAAASSASPSKGAKAAKRGGAAAAPSTSVIGNGPDDIPARFGGCSFLYRDTTYVLGANMRGVFECFSIVPAEDGPTSPTAGAGRSVSPKKSKKGASSSAGGGDQLSSPTKNLSNSLGQSKMTAKQVPITGTKAPPPRTLPAICVASTAGGGGATSAATHKAATTSPPAASITIEGQQACDSFFNCQVSSVYVHGGLQLSTSSEADATATLGNAVSTPASSGSGLDDLWEFKCHQMGWQPVAVRTSLLSKRFAHSLAFAFGRLYLFGGVDSRTLGTLGDFWVLEDSGNAGKRWTPVISHGTCSAGSASGVDDASVMRLQRPCARSHHNLVPAPDGCLLLHGGISTHGAILNDLWCVRVAHEASLASVYDPVTEASLANISCIPLVVWRRVELPGDYIPRKLGSTLLVAPMPKLPQAAARRSSTAATAAIVTFHQNEYSLTPQYLILICGGWDADSLSPFVAPRPQHHANQHAGVQNNPPTTTSDYEPSPMMQRLASMAFSSVDGGSFRFASFRRGSTAGDTPLRMLEKSMSPFRRRQSQAERDHDDGSQQQQQQAEQQPTATPMPPPVTKRQPLVVAFVANMDKWRADHNPSEFTSSPRSSAAHGEAHGGLENADLESLGSHGVGQGGRGVSPQPKQPAPAAAVALSKSKVLGKRFTVANSAGRLAQSTFSRASHRSCDYVTSLATLQKQLVPPRLEISKLDSVAISSSAMVPPAVHSPVSRTGPPTLDASALAVKKDDGGADGAMSSSDCLPIATMFGYWCRSQASTGGKQSQSASALELTAFGGNCGPMVACGDVWRCRVEWLPQPMFDFNKTVPFNSL